MATFKTKLTELVGDIPATVADSALDNFFTATASEILQIIPASIAIRYAADATETDSSGFDTANKRIIGVIRNDYNAEEVSIGLKAAISDINSIHYRSARTPVFYFDSSTMYIEPAPTVSETAIIKHIAYPTVATTDTSVTGFPSTAEYAIVLGAAVKYLHDVFNTTVNENDDIELAQAIKVQIDSLNSLYQAELQRIAGLT